MWWIAVIGIVVEIIKLLISLRKEKDAKDLETEYEAVKAEYQSAGDRAVLERFRDRLRQRRDKRAG